MEATVTPIRPSVEKLAAMSRENKILLGAALFTVIIVVCVVLYNNREVSSAG